MRVSVLQSVLQGMPIPDSPCWPAAETPAKTTAKVLSYGTVCRHTAGHPIWPTAGRWQALTVRPRPAPAPAWQKLSISITFRIRHLACVCEGIPMALGGASFVTPCTARKAGCLLLPHLSRLPTASLSVAQRTVFRPTSALRDLIYGPLSNYP